MGRARPLARLERLARVEAETARIVELYRELDDAEAVAERLGVRPFRVRMRMREAGVSPVILRIERTVEIFKKEGTVEATAERLGVGFATVRRRLESGVVLRLLDAVPEASLRVRLKQSRDGESRPHVGRGRALDPTAEGETIALYEELRSLRLVAERLNISHEAVRLRLQNAGFHLERRPCLTKEERERAVALYQELRSMHAVAKLMGRAPLTVRNALVKEGVVLHRGGWHEKQRPERIARKVGEARIMKRLYDRVGSERAVADLLGMSQTLVSNRLKLIDEAPGRGRHGPKSLELVTGMVALCGNGAGARL